MTYPSLTEVARAMFHHVHQLGRKPLFYVMNQATADTIAKEVTANYREHQSTLQRAWFWLRHRRNTPRLEELHGLPVRIEPGMHDGGILLQSANLAHMPSDEQLKAAAEAPHGGVPAEFLRRERIDLGAEAQAQQASAEGEVRPTLDDLSKSGDWSKGIRPTATDVLIKALDGAETLRGVVVIRVHSGGDVDLCLNVNEFEASGVLQKAHQYLAMRGCR